MARGFSTQIAMITRASDRAGSNARNQRLMATERPFGRVRLAPMASSAISRSLCEGGLDNALFSQLVARQVRNDTAIVEHEGVVAVFQLVCLGCVPEERTAVARFLADQLVDLALGVYINAPHRIVHQDDLGIRSERPRKQRFLLVATSKREDVVAHVR